MGSYGDIFITKYNSAGALQWAKQSNSVISGATATAYSVAADGLGNSYVTGVISGSVAFGKDTLKASFSGTFLVKYSPNGNVLCAKTDTSLSTSDFACPLSVSSDNYGNSYIGGYYTGSVIFGKDTLPLTPLGETNSFLVKYDLNGNVLWVWSPTMLSGWGVNHIQSISSDNNGNTYVTGTFSTGNMYIGNDTLVSTTRFTPFLAKFNPTGNVSWAQQVYELDNHSWGTISVSVDSIGSGCILLKDSGGANTSLSIKLGSDTLRYNLGNFMMDALFQFDSAGNVSCGTMFGEETEDDGDGMCVSPSGKYVYVAGDIYYLSKALFGQDTLKNSSNSSEPSFIGSWQPCTNIETPVNSIQTNEGVNLFPNPNNGIFTISFSHPELVSGSQTIIEVYNILGQKVSIGMLKQVQHDYMIDISNQPNGVYFYRVLSINGTLIADGKLIIQK